MRISFEISSKREMAVKVGGKNRVVKWVGLYLAGGKSQREVTGRQSLPKNWMRVKLFLRHQYK